jgi:hypothetical protein
MQVCSDDPLLKPLFSSPNTTDIAEELPYNYFAQSVVQLNGFVVNPQDRCVFNKNEKDKQCTICVYVDDLFITCENEIMLDKTTENLKRQF